jgi:tetratricopeptide (TPR) repeat protein
MGLEGEARTHFHRAQLELAHGNTRGAIQALRWALSIDPRWATAHALLALCLHDEKRLYAAEHEAKLALGLDPEAHIAHVAMAVVLIAKRKLDAAEEHLEIARRIDPESPDTYRQRARILQLRGRRDEAIAELERGLSLDPEDVHTHVALGELYLAAGDVARAGAVATEVLRADAENHDALVLRGGVLLRHGRVDDAREHAFWALRQRASSRSALALLVHVKARQSVWLGLWWRCNAWLGALSVSGRIFVLLGGFTAYRVLTIAATQHGWAAPARAIEAAWLCIVVYSWIGPAVFQRMLARELATVRLRRGF